MPGKKISDLDVYDDVNSDKSRKNLYEVSKNTGTYASPTYATNGSRKITQEQLREELNIKEYLVRDFIVVGSGGTIVEDKVNAIIVTVNETFTLPTASSSNYGKSIIIANRCDYTITINGIVNGTSIKLTNFNEVIQLSCLFDGVSTYGWWLVSDAINDKICTNRVVLNTNTYTAKHNDSIKADALSIGSDVNITIPSASIEGRLIYVYYPTGSPSAYVVNLIGGFSATLEQLDYFLIRDNGSYWEAISTSQNTATVEPAYNLSVPTGVCEGGVLSINADPTKFNISDGFGYITDLYTDPDPANATITKVTWSGLTAQTVTNLATSTVSFIYINSAGAIVQTTVQPTEQTLRDYIYLGQLGHSNFTSIQTAISQPSVAQSPMSQLRDLWTELKYLNDGNLISANGTNLSLNKSNGNLIGLGLNFENAIKTPNKKNFPAQTLATIRRRTQTGGTGTSTTLDVANYDLGGTVTSITGTKAQNQRVFILPSGNLIVQYGQTLYNSLTDAVQGIETETFVELENVKTGQLIAIISVTSNCTSLQDTSRARIKNVGKFGEVNVGAGASSVSTLNQAYLNSTPTPKIDTTIGAVSFVNGGANNTVDVIEVKNLANSQTFSVDGNGLIKSAQATASTPAFFSSVKGIISATGALLGTFFQTLTADTNPVDADTIVVNDSTASFEAKKTTLLQFWTNYIKPKADAVYLLLSGGTLTGSLNYPSFSTLASASTTNIGSVNNNYIEITGTTNITSFGTASAGVVRILRFTGVLTIFNNGTSLILPNGIDITTKANDIVELVSLGSGNWICTVVTQGSLGNYVDLNTTQTITGQKTFSRDTGSPTTGTATGTVITQLDCARIINSGKYIFYVSGDNVSIGKNAGHGSASLCTVMGSGAGNWSMSGQQNCLYGYQAGTALTNGICNVINGSQAGQSLTTGNYNVYHGFGAGYGAGGANSNNVYIGSFTGDNKSESFRLRIHSSTSFGSTPIIYGEFDNRTLRFDVNSLSIGSTNANASAQLDLQGTNKGFLKNRLTSAQIASVSTPAQGLEMFDTDLRNTVFLPVASGNPIRTSGTMFTQTANKQVQNTVTETSLVGTGVGSATIKANSSGIGTTYRLSMCGYISNTGTPFAQVKVKIGSVTVFDTTSTGMFGITSNQPFKVNAVFTVRTLGASGTVIGQGEFEYATSASTQYQIMFQANTATSTIDTTVDQTVDITFTWGTANASNSINSTNFTLERL